jgi:hypothetical protein
VVFGRFFAAADAVVPGPSAVVEARPEAERLRVVLPPVDEVSVADVAGGVVTRVECFGRCRTVFFCPAAASAVAPSAKTATRKNAAHLHITRGMVFLVLA